MIVQRSFQALGEVPSCSCSELSMYGIFIDGLDEGSEIRA